MNGCPFCRKIAAGRDEHGSVSPLCADVAHFEPLNPVTPGHRLFVPFAHIEHARAGNLAVARCVEQAISYARRNGIEDYNLIQSNGASATQTVPHVHVHLVPRREGDGLALPWTDQQKEP